MRVVFMGTPEFAVPSLQALIDAGYEIPLVFTQPDKKGNRGKVIPSPVKVLAESAGIQVAQPFSLRKEPDAVQLLRDAEPDIIVVAAFGQILPQEVLDIPKIDCINVHGSLLPDLRGASPMQAAILRGYDITGVTIMKMEAGLDTGPMISTVSCIIDGKNIFEVAEMLANAGAKLLVDTLPSIIDGTALYFAQNDDESTYAKMIKKTDGMTDFNEPADVLERKIRAYMDWPTLYSYLDDNQIRFFAAEPLMNDKCDGEPGTISEICKDYFTLNCQEGKLKILELQAQGKKRMLAGDFLRGHKLEKGMKFNIKEEI